MSRLFEPETFAMRAEFTEEASRSAAMRAALDEQIQNLESVLGRLPDATFIGDGPFAVDPAEQALLAQVIQESSISPAPDAEQLARLIELGTLSLRKFVTYGASTGIVFAGFGSSELFPTLISYEILGIVGPRLKVSLTNHVDIDREGVRARVIPFAQREMVERFLYGLDKTIENQITEFCRQSVPLITERTLAALDLEMRDRLVLETEASNAQLAFFNGLTENGFEAIRQQSREEIEDMVEFMPKPEMARMAEALVNLTSIKRRVSRGFETVGGAIDVAIISQAEGFVWVKRKHYFEAELNSRYMNRMRAPLAQ